MKKIFLLLALVGLAATVQAGLKTTGFTGASTNNIAATSQSNYTSQAAIVLTGSKSCYLQTTFNLTGSGTSAVTFFVDRSVDNSSWQTNVMSFSVTPAGTATVQGGTNFDSGGCAYFRIGAITNASATAVTNLVIKYYYKLGL